MEAKRLDPIKFACATTVADVAQLREDQATKEETFHTQEGCIRRLRKAIISSVSRAIVLEHYSTNNGFNLVHPRDLLATIMQNAAPVTVTDGRTLKKARDKDLTFHTSAPLSVQFAEAQQAIEQLQTLHAVPSSKAELMMLRLRDIERKKDFEEQVDEWKKKSSGKSLATFVSFFARRNREVRRRNKIRTAVGGGYHSAANIREEDLEQRIIQHLESQVELEMANMAEHVTDAIESAAGIKAPRPSKQPTPSATAYTATADGGASGDILTLLKAMDTRLQKIESRRQNCKPRNRQNTDSSNASSGGSGGGNNDGGAKCKHCNLVHPKTAEADCWTFPENASSAPAWFIRKLEKKCKGK